MTKKNVRPAAVCHIDANITPEQLLPHLGEELEDKIYFVYTGGVPMDHPQDIDIIEKMMEDAEKLFEYKPVLLSMGCDALMHQVTSEEVAEISDLLKNPKCKRQGQVLHDYIQLFKACLEAIDEFGLDPPALFRSGQIDCTSLTYFNRPQEVKMYSY